MSLLRIIVVHPQTQNCALHGPAHHLSMAHLSIALVGDQQAQEVDFETYHET